MALTASPDDQERLLELQGLDTRLQQVEHRVRSLPQIAQLAELSRQGDALAREQAQRRGDAEDAAADLRRIESDVALVESRIARDTERLQGSSSMKDVQALEQELVSLRRRLDELEDLELAAMERSEQLQTSLAESEKELAELAERRREVDDERGAALVELEVERAEVVRSREELAARLPGDLLALYERQRARYGVGASLLRGGVSSASGVKLTESDMAKIRAAAPDAVLLCPDSEAVLVRTGESGL